MSKSSFNLFASVRSGQDVGTMFTMALLPTLITVVSFYYEVMPHIVYVGSKVLMVLLPPVVLEETGHDLAIVIGC